MIRKSLPAPAFDDTERDLSSLFCLLCKLFSSRNRLLADDPLHIGNESGIIVAVLDAERGERLDKGEHGCAVSESDEK